MKVWEYFIQKGCLYIAYLSLIEATRWALQLQTPDKVYYPRRMEWFAEEVFPRTRFSWMKKGKTEEKSQMALISNLWQTLSKGCQS